MPKKIIAEFNDALKADDAMSNLTEAGYKPKQTTKKSKTFITLAITSKTIDNAKEILQDAGATIIQSP